MLFKKHRINKLRAKIFVYKELEIQSRVYAEGIETTSQYHTKKHLKYLKKLLEFKLKLAALGVSYDN